MLVVFVVFCYLYGLYITINMKKILLLTAAALLNTVNLFAEESKTVTINGNSIDKITTKITFEGDNAVLHFTDGTTMSADMSTVNISLVPDITNSIRNAHVFTTKDIEGNTIAINGTKKGDAIAIYNLQGNLEKKMYCNSSSVNIDISRLTHGTYILCIANEIIKFNKK
jgi:hypothetical protein